MASLTSAVAVSTSARTASFRCFSVMGSFTGAGAGAGAGSGSGWGAAGADASAAGVASVGSSSSAGVFTSPVRPRNRLPPEDFSAAASRLGSAVSSSSGMSILGRRFRAGGVTDSAFTDFAGTSFS